MKKIFKKSIACLIALIMVFSALPLTPPISAEAAVSNSNAQLVIDAMTAFEQRMNGTIYNNMVEAYNAYVDANTALNNACKTGNDSELAQAASNLNEKISKLTVWSAPVISYVTPSFNNGDVAGDYYSNVLYSSGVSDNDFVTYFTSGDGGYKAKLHTNKEIVLLIDGNTEPSFPITLEGVKEKSGSWGAYSNVKFNSAGIENNANWSIKQNWLCKVTDWNNWPSGTAQTLTNIHSKTATTSAADNNTYIFGNKVSYTGQCDNSNYYEVYNNSNNIVVRHCIFGGGKKNQYDEIDKELNVFTSNSNAGTVYVLNYKALKVAMSNALKVDVKQYKQGGLLSVLTAINNAKDYNPNSASTGATNASTIATTFSKSMQNFISSINGAKTIDDSSIVEHSDTSYDWTVTTEANCTEKGSKNGVCKYCGATTTAEIPTTGHAEVIDKAVAPNCTETGLTEGKHCSVCNKVLVAQQTVDALGHDLKVVDGSDKAPTCTVDGKEVDQKCSRCDYTESGATIPATGLHDYDVAYDKQTNTDIFTCKNCGDTYSKTVADMSALNHAIEQLEALVNDDGANYKYEANALANAKNVVATAKDFVQKADRYAEQPAVNGQAKEVNETITTLTTTGLAQYTVTFNLVNADTGDTIENASSKMKYGDIAEKSYTFNKDEDGFPEYVVCKWTKKVLNDKGEAVESVINSTSNDISVVVKENATYTCYVLKFKASTEGENATTRVRYLDKSGKTLKIDYATVGSKYEIDESVVAPKLPYYRFTEWERVYGENNPVGTREIVYQARYSYSDSEANVCEIVGLGDVKVNGSQSCKAIYDSKVVLTGATKYAFCDKDGNKIISYINEDYIYTPRVNETVYIKAVVEEVTTATTAITGSFVQKNAGTLADGVTKYHNLYVNAQFYLPEDATAVEAGLVLSKSVSEENELQIGKDKVTKLVSNSQGTNHEYSMAMSFANDGTVHARSYLIYVDKSGTTHTVYSAVKTIEYKA